jgi:uncharacterized membrane protein (DUF106 family)
MGVFSFLDPVLNVIFGPLLRIDALLAIIIISFIISLLIVIIYKWTTDQNLMKSLKDEIKALQAQVKTLKDKPEEALAVQKRAMETNMKYMMQSLKPTLVTFIPIILIFGWLSGHLAFDPLLPGSEFTATLDLVDDLVGNISVVTPKGITVIGDASRNITDGVAVFTFTGDSGKYVLTFDVVDQGFSKEVIISDKKEYADVIETYKGNVRSITLSNAKAKILNLFGWQLGWLGTYIIFSVIFSLVLRKLMKVY